MTTQQQTDDDILANLAHVLRQRTRDARNWEHQAHDWEHRCKAQRDIIIALSAEYATNDRARAVTRLVERLVAAEQERDTLTAETERRRAENNQLCNDVAQLQHDRDGADEYASEMEWKRQAAERQFAELSQVVGAETPIAALTLAETWQAEKAALMEEIAELKEQRADLLWRARAVYRYVRTYKTTRDGDEARMAVGEELWAAGATDPDKREP